MGRRRFLSRVKSLGKASKLPHDNHESIPRSRSSEGAELRRERLKKGVRIWLDDAEEQEPEIHEPTTPTEEPVSILRNGNQDPNITVDPSEIYCPSTVTASEDFSCDYDSINGNNVSFVSVDSNDDDYIKGLFADDGAGGIFDDDIDEEEEDKAIGLSTKEDIGLSGEDESIEITEAFPEDEILAVLKHEIDAKRPSTPMTASTAMSSYDGSVLSSHDSSTLASNDDSRLYKEEQEQDQEEQPQPPQEDKEEEVEEEEIEEVGVEHTLDEMSLTLAKIEELSQEQEYKLRVEQNMTQVLQELVQLVQLRELNQHITEMKLQEEFDNWSLPSIDGNSDIGKPACMSLDSGSFTTKESFAEETTDKGATMDDSLPVEYESDASEDCESLEDEDSVEDYDSDESRSFEDGSMGSESLEEKLLEEESTFDRMVGVLEKGVHSLKRRKAKKVYAPNDDDGAFDEEYEYHCEEDFDFDPEFDEDDEGSFEEDIETTDSLQRPFSAQPFVRFESETCEEDDDTHEEVTNGSSTAPRKRVRFHPSAVDEWDESTVGSFESAVDGSIDEPLPLTRSWTVEPSFEPSPPEENPGASTGNGPSINSKSPPPGQEPHGTVIPEHRTVAPVVFKRNAQTASKHQSIKTEEKMAPVQITVTDRQRTPTTGAPTGTASPNKATGNKPEAFVIPLETTQEWESFDGSPFKRSEYEAYWEVDEAPSDEM